MLVNTNERRTKRRRKGGWGEEYLNIFPPWVERKREPKQNKNPNQQHPPLQKNKKPSNRKGRGLLNTLTNTIPDAGKSHPFFSPPNRVMPKAKGLDVTVLERWTSKSIFGREGEL